MVVVRSRLTAPLGPISPPHASAGMADNPMTRTAPTSAAPARLIERTIVDLPLGGRSVRTGPVGALDSAHVALVPATVRVGHSPIAGCRHLAPAAMLPACTIAACGRR